MKTKQKTKAKSKLINLKRLEEMKEKVIDLFIAEKITIFESRIIIKDILDDDNLDRQIGMMNNVLETLKGGSE